MREHGRAHWFERLRYGDYRVRGPSQSLWKSLDDDDPFLRHAAAARLLNSSMPRPTRFGDELARIDNANSLPCCSGKKNDEASRQLLPEIP
jgi:hypothetical protein